MGAPTVPFQVMAKGYRVHGGQDGIRATVPCLVDWQNAFIFHDQVLGFPQSAGVKKSIIYQTPWRFPASRAAIWATECNIEPIGANGLPLAATYGLAPGEFFTKAICTVEFQTLSFYQPDDNQNQLDPNNPIAFCTQKVRGGAKMITQKGITYTYSGGTYSGKPLVGDIGVVQPECRLVLEYPWIPFQPWQFIQQYVGSLNSYTIFGCTKGTLLFEDFDTEAVATTQGLQGQKVMYTFAWQPYDWNMIPDPTGVPIIVNRADGSGASIYAYNDFTQFFL